MLTKNEKGCLILSLSEKLMKVCGVCTKYHILVSVYILQNVYKIPLNFHFFPYKKSLYSEELQASLAELRASWLLKLKNNGSLYSPNFILTKEGRKFLSKFHKKVKKYDIFIDSCVYNFKNKSVKWLYDFMGKFINISDNEIKYVWYQELDNRLMHNLMSSVVARTEKKMCKFIPKEDTR